LRHTAARVPSAVPRQHKLALTRSLPDSIDALWQSLDKKVRNQVRKGQKEGLTVEFGGRSLVDDFYSVFAHNMRDLGTPVYAKDLFSRTLEEFPDQARVCVVRHDRRPIGAAICMRFRETVLVPWASSLRAYRNLNANMLLYWSLMESATREGARIFDFGRSSPESGPHRFKLQWGAAETPMTWEYLALTKQGAPSGGADDPRFRYAVAVWKHLPVWLTTIAGPRIVRAIP
jgi:FemAB-related protein (PEP-CTERM system-associated)